MLLADSGDIEDSNDNDDNFENPENLVNGINKADEIPVVSATGVGSSAAEETTKTLTKD